MKLSVSYRTKFTSLLMMMAILCTALPGVAAADSTSTTTGGITVFNTGTLKVSYGGAEITFATETGGPASVSSVSGDTMYADVTLTVEDGRAEGARSPYSISLSLRRPENGGHYIDLSNLSVIGVTGLPEGDVMTVGFPGEVAPLSAGVTVVQAGDQPTTTTYTVTVQIRMFVPAGTVPGDYASTLRLETGPGVGGNRD